MTEDRLFAKCAWRLIPFIVLLYVVSFVDRSNVGFAALTMNKDLGFSPEVFGFGAGIFFVGYSLFQVPANTILERLGAKRWMFCILASWGLISAANALVQGPISFYAIRFALGVAEAGLFPGMLLYLTYWFPRTYLPRFTATFMVAIPLSFVIGGPLASLILRMDGVAGLWGWQWLFLLEGLPAFLLSFAALAVLPDGPQQASWLTPEERQEVTARLAAEDVPGKRDMWRALSDSRVLALGIANFVFQSAAYGVSFWLPQIVRAMGFSNSVTGFVAALPFLAGAVAMVAGGHSSSLRSERIWHVAMPWLLAALSFAVASIAPFYWIVLAAVTVGEIGLLGGQGTFFSLPPYFLRGNAAAAAGIGVFNTLGSLGGFFGPSLIGLLKAGGGDFTSSLLAVSLGFVLASLIVLGIGQSLMPQKPVTAAARA